MSSVGLVTNASGTITTGGTSQQIAAQDGSRRYLFIQNPRDETLTLFVNFTDAAAANASVELGPGDALEFIAPAFVPCNAININAATTGHNFICKIG